MEAVKTQFQVFYYMCEQLIFSERKQKTSIAGRSIRALRDNASGLFRMKEMVMSFDDLKMMLRL